MTGGLFDRYPTWRIIPSRIPRIKSPPLIHWNPLGFPTHMAFFFFRSVSFDSVAVRNELLWWEIRARPKSYWVQARSLIAQDAISTSYRFRQSVFGCQDAVQNLIAQHSRKNLNQFQQHAFIFLCGCFYNPYGIPLLLPSHPSQNGIPLLSPAVGHISHISHIPTDPSG